MSATLGPIVRGIACRTWEQGVLGRILDDVLSSPGSEPGPSSFSSRGGSPDSGPSC